MQSPQQPDQALSLIIGAPAVDVFGLALAPLFLRAICSIPSFGIAKFAVNVCSLDTSKNANKTDGRRELLRVFSMRRENFPENKESNQTYNLLLLLVFSVWCPWPESNQHSLRNSILSRARLPVPPQGPALGGQGRYRTAPTRRSIGPRGGTWRAR